MSNSDLPQGGIGNWQAFDKPLQQVLDLTNTWREIIGPVEKPWMVWHVSDQWTVLQQRLVKHFGWTPIVGGDPRAGTPPLEPGSVAIDFNAGLNYSPMYSHFPLEFIFRFTGRKMAFWHSDLLVRLDVLESVVDTFEKLRPGEMTAVLSTGGLRNLLSPGKHRYWELIGCSTSLASKSQFESGAGWWMNFAYHPNCPNEAERNRRKKLYWDHGTGIMYWKRNYGGKVLEIKETKVNEGHCSSIGKANYNWGGGTTKNRTLFSALDLNYNIRDVAKRLGIERFLD